MQIIDEALKEVKKNKKNYVLLYIEEKLRKGNHQSEQKNKQLAFQLFIEMIVAAVIYVLYCYKFFHGLWYLKVLIAICTFIFLICYLNFRLEMINNKGLKDIPETISQLRFNFLDTHNIYKALEQTEKNAPDTTQLYVRQLKEAVNSKDVKLSIYKIKKDVKAVWLKMICTLVYYCKVNGDTDEVITLNLQNVTNIIEVVNLKQAFDNASLYGAQLFIFFGPLIGIPIIDLYNSYLLQAFESKIPLDTLNSQIIAGTILLLSNVFTLFISWVRKSN